MKAEVDGREPSHSNVGGMWETTEEMGGMGRKCVTYVYEGP